MLIHYKINLGKTGALHAMVCENWVLLIAYVAVS